MAGGYKELVVWQKSVELVVLLYKITDSFPKVEQFGLTSQIRRAAVSIPSNIAEGSKRSTENDFKHFLSMAWGSGAELDTQLEIARRLGFLDNHTFEQAYILLTEVMKMLPALKNHARVSIDS